VSADEEREAALSEFVERRERGEPVDDETFARERGGRPELLAALRALRATERLLPSGSLDLPARVGAYRVRGEIGRGGMGRVLEVEDPARPGEPLALKVLHIALSGEPRAAERFRREGRALERLQHPWIVRVHATGMADDRPYLLMERVEGAPLSRYLQAARERGTGELAELPGEGSSLQRAVRLVARAARAMAAAHREGVLHRDLNPRNILVRANGEPVVIDFGLVRAIGVPTLTGSGDLLGTPQYMAPEQARGERVDERSDVFCLGAVLRELLTLAPPRAADDTLALVRDAGGRPLARVRDQRIPKELLGVAERATSFFPRWRTPSCEALAADLERWLEGEPVRARAPGVFVRTLECLHVRRRPVLLGGTLLVACAAWFLARGAGEAEERQRRRIEATTAIVQPWFDGDPAGARAAFERCLALEPELPFAEFLSALDQDELPRDAVEVAADAALAGARALREGRPAEALDHFRTAWDLAPGYPFLLLLQGVAAFEAGRLEEARALLEPAAFHFGRSVRMHRTLAALYEALALPEDAQRARSAASALER
jgi:hypothetical protein